MFLFIPVLRELSHAKKYTYVNEFMLKIHICELTYARLFNGNEQ